MDKTNMYCIGNGQNIYAFLVCLTYGTPPFLPLHVLQLTVYNSCQMDINAYIQVRNSLEPDKPHTNAQVMVIHWTCLSCLPSDVPL